MGFLSAISLHVAADQARNSWLCLVIMHAPLHLNMRSTERHAAK